jgi:formyl-CoA transferase
VVQAYAGLFVLDAGQGVAGPYCGMLLAACGAEVVKLEPPEGDWSRGLMTRQAGQSVLHACFNRGKRSVMLDLKTDAGRAAAARLAARADVLIESFRPGVAARLGLAPESAKPDAVCLSVSGFGQQGPYAERPCTDTVAQAFSGLAALNEGQDGVPHKVGAIVSDIFTGLSGFAAVQAALAERARDVVPRRRVLDVSLMAGTAALIAPQIAEAGLLGRMPGLINVPAGCYRAACGGYVMITLVREPEFAGLCRVLGVAGLAEEPRFASFTARAENRAALLPLLRDAFAARDAAHWVAALQAERLLAERVNTPNDWLADPHVVAVGAVGALAQPELGTLPVPALPGIGAWLPPAPALGADNAALLEA